jgi:hypothetical protein
VLLLIILCNTVLAESIDLGADIVMHSAAKNTLQDILMLWLALFMKEED